MNLKKLFQKNQNQSPMSEFLEKNNITPERIIPLQKITGVIEDALDEKLGRLEFLEEKIDRLNHSIENVDSPFKEVKDLKKKIEVLEHDNGYLRGQNERMEKTIEGMENKIRSMIENDELKKTKDAYRALLVFAFNNMNPVTPFDPAHAKAHWENLIR
jgi:predicted RNase H-like nuclease (RuvC/YqgF family)